MINDADLLKSQGSRLDLNQYRPGADFIVLKILQVIAGRAVSSSGYDCVFSILTIFISSCHNQLRRDLSNKVCIFTIIKPLNYSTV